MDGKMRTPTEWEKRTNERAAVRKGKKKKIAVVYVDKAAKNLCVNWCNISVVSILCVGCALYAILYTLFSFIRSTVAHTSIEQRAESRAKQSQSQNEAM